MSTFRIYTFKGYVFCVYCRARRGRTGFIVRLFSEATGPNTMINVLILDHDQVSASGSSVFKVLPPSSSFLIIWTIK